MTEPFYLGDEMTEQELADTMVELRAEEEERK